MRTRAKIDKHKAMKMVIAVAALLASSAHGTLLAQVKDARSPVTIRLVGDDGLTQKLALSLEEAAAKSSKVRLADPTERSAVFVESDTNVVSDTLGGRSVLIYAVRVRGADGIAAPVTGVCYERAVTKCMVAIMRVVELQANLNGS